LAREVNNPNRYRLTAISMLVAASALLGSCSLLPEEQKPLKPPLVKPAEAEVRTVDVARGSIVRQISSAGHWVPTQIAYYQFQTGGILDTVEIRSGETVAQGDLLAALVNEGAEIELLQRELEYEKKKLALEEALMSGNEKAARIARIDYELADLLFAKTKERVENTVLRAATDGLVSYATDLKPGDGVDAERVIAAIADPSGMRIAVEAGSNPVLADIDVGMEAEIVYKGNALKGLVTQTPSSAPLTDDARLREEYGKTLYIDVEQLPEDAVLGATADVRIVAARRDDALIVPKRGVRTYFGRTYVQVLEGERRKEVDVETGLENATEIEIVQGVEEGMKIILQ